ncbi:MAG: hypothetical protein CL607_11710 [Anaerolineaceae bacterium]|nr:hypothetical protein [Anaerolineaceae bacterium]
MMPTDQPNIDTLLALLQGNDPSQRQQAAIALSSIKDERIIEPLLAALSDADSTVRANAATGLGTNKATQAVDTLIERLQQDEQDIVRERAAAALAQIGDERAIGPLIDALDDPANWVRNRVIYVLGASRDARAVDPLLELLDHDDVTTRSNAAWALGAIGDERALHPLLSLLQSKEASLRANGAWALGELAHPQAIEPVMALLRDASSEVRSKAAWALGSLGELTGDTQMVPALIALLEDYAEVASQQSSHVFVCQYAAEALLQISTDDAQKAVEHWRPLAAEKLRPYQIKRLIGVFVQGDKQMVDAAVAQLAEIGPPAIPQLSEALQHKLVKVRQPAVRALGQIARAEAGPALMMALADADPGVWSQAVAALVAIGKPIVPLLQPALNSKNLRVRNGAALALWRIQREAEAFQVVLAALSDEEMLVRSGALIALIQQPDERALATLQIRLNEEDEVMARYVLQALNAIGNHAAMATIAHWLAHHQN